MIERLDSLGIENQVFVPTYDRSRAVIQPNSNVCVCEAFRKWDRLLFDYKQKKIRKSLEANISVPDFDLIHAYTLFTDGNCARVLSKKYGIPYVVAIRNTDVNSFFRLMPHLRSRGVDIMRDASAVFFLSGSYKDQVFDRYVPRKYHEEIEKKTHIIPNGIDDFWFQNEPTEPKRADGKAIRLVYAGRIDRNKNIPTTQKAMELLRNEGYNVSLTVVGNVQEQAEFQRVQKDPYTKYFPAMPKEKLIHIYRQSDIFVMPSFTESFGLVYAEAMSQGLPVIYSKGQGFDGQFDEGTVGCHVDPHDPEELCRCIVRITEAYPRFYPSCIAASKKFEWMSLASEYLNIYHAITENTSR